MTPSQDMFTDLPEEFALEVDITAYMNAIIIPLDISMPPVDCPFNETDYPTIRTCQKLIKLAMLSLPKMSPSFISKMMLKHRLGLESLSFE